MFASVTPEPNAIPITDGSGVLDPGFIPDRSALYEPVETRVTQSISVVTAVGPPPVIATLHFTNGFLTSVT